MAIAQPPIDVAFAERERTIAIQQARRRLILGSCGLGAAIVSVAGLLILDGTPTADLCLATFAGGALLNWWNDLSRWRWLRRSSPSDVLIDLQQPDPPDVG